MKYNDSNHSSVGFSAMNQMRHSGTLCDVTLHVAGIDVLAHRVVLAATSAYFNAMFNSEIRSVDTHLIKSILSPGEMLEKSLNRVIIQAVEPVALQLLIDYAYTGQIEITDENVQSLLPAASLLQMDVIREACCSFLLHQLDASNCLGIRLFAHTHSCEELQVTSHQYALNNFIKVSKEEEFLSLSFEEISSLVSSSQLNVTDEETVYKAVMRWLKHDLTGRREHFATLLSYVRLPLLSREFLLSQVVEESLIRTDSEAKDLLIEAMRYHLCPEERAVEQAHNARTTTRRPEGLQPVIFAIGGGSLFSTINSEFEYYCPGSDTWTYVQSSQRRSRAGLTTLNNKQKIVVIGGYNGSKELNSVETYSPLSNAWEKGASMGSPRSCFGVCSLNGNQVVVAGGFDGNAVLNSSEMFDAYANVWYSFANMEIRRKYCRLVELNQAIYAVGGFDGVNYHSSVSRFDPREGKWARVAPMITPRSSCGATVLAGKVFVSGGNNGNNGSCPLSSVERYDPAMNAWESVASMQTRRSTHELVEVNDTLFAIGGTDGSASLNSVEKYCPLQNTGKWVPVKAMNLRRSNLGAVVLYCQDLGSSFARQKEIPSAHTVSDTEVVMDGKSNEDISTLLPPILTSTHFK